MPIYGIANSTAMGGGAVQQAIAATYKSIITVANSSAVPNTLGAGLYATGKLYDILIGTNTTHAGNQAFMKSLPYDPQADFEPITRLALASLLLAAISVSTVVWLYYEQNPFLEAFEAKSYDLRFKQWRGPIPPSNNIAIVAIFPQIALIGPHLLFGYPMK